MTQRLFGVNIAYNGNRPHVTMNISWNRMFAGIWQSIKDFGNSVKNFMQQQWKRGNVYAMYVYSVGVVALTTWCIVSAILMMGGELNLNIFWQEWTLLLSTQFGITIGIHQVAVLVFVFASLSVLNAPASEWGKFSAKVWRDSQMTSAEKWNALIQKADEMTEKYQKTITNLCGGILMVAGTTAIVWVIWTMLQG